MWMAYIEQPIIVAGDYPDPLSKRYIPSDIRLSRLLIEDNLHLDDCVC